MYESFYHGLFYRGKSHFYKDSVQGKVLILFRAFFVLTLKFLSLFELEFAKSVPILSLCCDIFPPETLSTSFAFANIPHCPPNSDSLLMEAIYGMWWYSFLKFSIRMFCSVSKNAMKRYNSFSFAAIATTIPTPTAKFGLPFLLSRVILSFGAVPNLHDIPSFFHAGKLANNYAFTELPVLEVAFLPYSRYSRY